MRRVAFFFVAAGSCPKNGDPPRVHPRHMLLCGTDNARWLSLVTREARGLSPPFFQRQRQFLGCLDAIAAIALGLIKRAIGGREQHFKLCAGRPPPPTATCGGLHP